MMMIMIMIMIITLLICHFKTFSIPANWGRNTNYRMIQRPTSRRH